jgi:hypothetical protein
MGAADPYIWLQTNNTFLYNTNPLFTNLTNSSTILTTPTAATTFCYSDFALMGNATLIGSLDGFVRVSGLKSGRDNGGSLIIQDNLNTTVDIRGNITNLDPIVRALTFTPPAGVDFQTPLYNTEIIPTPQPLICNDTEGFQITSGILILGAAPGPVVTLVVSGTAGAEILSFTPNATLKLQGPTTDNISDKRVKQNITTVAPEDDLQFVLNLPRRVSYQHNSTFDADNTTTRHGYIAQELELVAPELVHSNPRVLRDGKTMIKDFRTVDLLAMVPRLAGALEAMYERQLVLEQEIERLKALIK